MSLGNFLQITLALGLFNVWLLRFSKETSYRGQSAKNLKEEFAAYGLPSWSYYFIGFLKLACAVVLLAGLWNPSFVIYAAVVILILMLGAIAMHLKVKDPFSKNVPAVLMLLMSVALVYVSTAQKIV